MPAEPPSPSDGEAQLGARIRTILEVAREHGVGIPLPDLAVLLPESQAGGAARLQAWLTAHPSEVTVRDGTAFPAALARDGPVPDDRPARAAAYLEAARHLVEGSLAGVARWARTIAVTGSVAYGAARGDDDCDLFAVTDDGMVWAFVALALWKTSPRTAGRDPTVAHWCLNYVLDQRTAAATFSQPRDPLFSREALAARPVLGTTYYQGLLERADWIRRDWPGLYERLGRAAPNPDAGADHRGPSPFARLLSAGLFLVVAPYLQLEGLVRNQRLRRQGRFDQMFEVRTRWGEYAVQSRKFARLREAYGTSARASP